MAVSDSANMTGPFDMDDAPGLLAKDAAGDNAPPLSVSEISGAVKRLVEGSFARVRVRGEISGYKRAASGHVYCSLKDDAAVIDAVMWKGQAARIAFRPEDGIEVIATGRLTTYPGRSKYQLVMESMEVAGEGALMMLFERLKAKLRAEGLFDEARKQALPGLPATIGVVTSPTGAVIRDILHRLADRFPTHVLVWPVLVQGEGAAAQIAHAIRGFDALPSGDSGGGAVPRPDLLIVARGGGSIEDLWSFNEEVVVRAIAECRIPVISAVGHETDTTLADHAADRRAPTPTAAAEMAVPVRAELRARLSEVEARMQAAEARRVALAGERLTALVRLLPRRSQLYEPQRQRLDDQAERLHRALRQRVANARDRFAARAPALRPALLLQRLAQDRTRLSGLWRLIETLDPKRLLAKGYAMVEGPDGAVLTSAAAARASGHMTLVFADDRVAVSTDDAAPSARSGARAKTPGPKSGSGGVPQGELF